MDEYSTDYVTLLDEDGGEHRFEILDIIEDNNEKFYALLPKIHPNNFSYTDDVCGYYIFQEIGNEKDQILAEVEDPIKLEKLSKILERRFENF